MYGATGSSEAPLSGAKRTPLTCSMENQENRHDDNPELMDRTKWARDFLESESVKNEFTNDEDRIRFYHALRGNNIQKNEIDNFLRAYKEGGPALEKFLSNRTPKKEEVPQFPPAPKEQEAIEYPKPREKEAQPDTHKQAA